MPSPSRQSGGGSSSGTATIRNGNLTIPWRMISQFTVNNGNMQIPLNKLGTVGRQFLAYQQSGTNTQSQQKGRGRPKKSTSTSQQRSGAST
jgi:hypothetical protein